MDNRSISEQFEEQPRKARKENVMNVQTAEEIIKAVYEEGFKAGLKYAADKAVCKAINELPPVNPTKTGHWIDREVYDADRWKCSECGRTEPYKEHYCPNCATKMSESEESE